MNSSPPFARRLTRATVAVTTAAVNYRGVRMAVLALRGAAKSFGSRQILDGLDFDVEAGRAPGRDRAERRRQVDDAAHPRRARDGRRGRIDVPARPRHRAPAAAARGRRSRCDRHAARRAPRSGRAGGRARPGRDAARRGRSRPHDPAARAPGRVARALDRRPGGRASTAVHGRCSPTSGWTTRTPRSRRGCSRAASGSSSGSQRACSGIPTSSCSTSPRRISTSKRGSSSRS